MSIGVNCVSTNSKEWVCRIVLEICVLGVLIVKRVLQSVYQQHQQEFVFLRGMLRMNKMIQLFREEKNVYL